MDTISGTHKGEWCGISGTGRTVKFHLAAMYLFGTGDDAGKLVAERIYFDNETVMRQINGDLDTSALPDFRSAQLSAAFGEP
jgi:predicted ester cyclase